MCLNSFSVYLSNAYEQAAMKKRAQPGVVESEKVIPPEYYCPICKKIMNNAVVVPCCGESFCDTCKLMVFFNW